MAVDAVRSEIMRAVGQANTAPELVVRRILHSLGLRFRLHRRDLVGTPDVVLPKHHTVLFVHGCFWHRHEGCSKTTSPKTRVDFWNAKFEQNVVRDRKNEKLLAKQGWTVLIVWECETKKEGTLRARLAELFGRGGNELEVMDEQRGERATLRPLPRNRRAR